VNNADHQRRLLSLIQGHYFPSADDDEYILGVAHSPHLEVVKEIVQWWRVYNVQRYCVLTCRLLKRKGLFDEAMRAFAGRRALSPYVERLGAMFLDEMSQHQDALVASVARFELALVRVRLGDPHTYIIEWGHDPEQVLGMIVDGRPIAEMTFAQCCARTIVSRELPALFVISYGSHNP
jgi:hypothetical protein